MQIFKFINNDKIILNEHNYGFGAKYYLIFPNIKELSSTNNNYSFNIIGWDREGNVNIYENIYNYNDLYNLQNKYYNNKYIFCNINDIKKINDKIKEWTTINKPKFYYNQYYIKIDYNENDTDFINYILSFLKNQQIINYLYEHSYDFRKLNFYKFTSNNDVEENIKMNIPKHSYPKWMQIIISICKIFMPCIISNSV